MTPGPETLPRSRAASAGAEWDGGDMETTPWFLCLLPGYPSDLLPLQRPVAMGGSLSKDAELGPPAAGDGGEAACWTSSEGLSWGSLGCCALQCRLAGSRQG